jgi:hypothetical protein
MAPLRTEISVLTLGTQEAGASILMTTLVYAGFNLIAALVSYPLTHLSDKLRRKTVPLGSPKGSE